MLNKILKTALCGFILLLSLLESYNILDSKKIENDNNENILFYYKEKDKEEYDLNKYIGVLNIPDINLIRGFYQPTSQENTLSKNILYLKESIPPDEKNSMLILAAHRGSSKVAFFNDLDKLSLGSIINLSYKDKNYTYILTYKYDEEKDGNLDIIRDKDKDSLILITCNKYKKKYQTIYVAYRKEVK